MENRHSCSKADRRKTLVGAYHRPAARIEKLKEEVPKEERKRMKQIRRSERENREKKEAARARATEEKENMATTTSSTQEEVEVHPLSARYSKPSTFERFSSQSSIPQPPSLLDNHPSSHFEAFASPPTLLQPLLKPSHNLPSQSDSFHIQSTALSSFIRSFVPSPSIAAVALSTFDSLGISDVDTLASILRLEKPSFGRFLSGIREQETKDLIESMASELRRSL